ncbi:LOW QUALITY PROTEIN: treslin [Thalassophryne amazonica]|uniref:LOW QUALITY PROTEIN: treslin n=1 Tax=Thalassophryne amazonica TaxID=390379 RepID=UPI0014724F1E|nr:LOW QUALITY PROTEIN: treslin [Thalassophryne amazonica]
MTVHNLVFVIDVDYGDQNSDSHLDVKSHFVKRGILRILLHFAYQYGFEKVRWGYKFFRSKRTGQCAGIKSRGSDFKELQHKTFEDFELEFESKFDGKDEPYPSQQIQKSSQSVQNAIKETLLDFQWDRPDMTSPTKLSLRPRKSNRAGNVPISQEDEPLGSCRNMLFIVSDCPRSRTQLMDYLSLRNQDMPVDVSEHIVSRGLKELLVQQQVVLHWIDSCSHVEVMRCANHFGFEKMSEVLVQSCGRVIPVVALLKLACPVKPQPHSGTETFAFTSSLRYLLSSEHFYRLVFPVTKAVLEWRQGNVIQCCGVTVEPVCRRQRFLPDSVKVSLKGVLQDWDLSSLTEASTESWVIQCSNSSDQGAPAFRRLLMELSAQTLHMFAEVKEDNLVCAAVLTPLSHVTAMLTILHPGMRQHDLWTAEIIGQSTDETSTDLPEVVSSVLEVVYGIMKEECHEANGKGNCPTNHQVPEWFSGAQPLSLQRDMLDNWFLHSDHSGVSAHLMASMRLLQAVPEQREEEELSVLQHMLISDLSDLYKKSQGGDNKRSKKRGSQRTPVKQKMKTMSRSLQMLNVARLNVKAQKNQNECEQLVAESKGPDKQCRRRSSERIKAGGPNTANFSSKAELLSFLNTSYDRILAERDSVLTDVQQLLSAVKVFMADSASQASLFVQQHLLKTSRSLRQLYGSAADAESKVRECQLQSLLRLELCRHFSSEQSGSLDGEQMAEEVAEMLRIISLTKDPVCLTRFLQEEILPGFLTAIPKVLADVYHSLGTQLPEALLALLPADFFSDESIAKDSVSPSVSTPPLSTHSLTLDSGHCLQHLRNRSANKKRSEVLTRHRSMIESSQSLRQIEMPKKTTRASKTKVAVAVERPSAEPQSQKQTQEVTKVRRNLFNQEIVSPSKKAKLPRSQSVSAVEGVKRKRSQGNAEGHKLLTKKVSDTPLHKQVSNRFLHLQKMGRRSMPTEECVVEESPEKPANDLRRSPRIKKFARRHSITFYSGSQPRSRNLDRALSASQLHLSDSRNSCIDLPTVRSPMRLLFGAAHSPGHQSTSVESHEPGASKTRLSTDSVFESPRKTPESPGGHWKISHGSRTPRTSRTQRTPNTPLSTKMSVSSVPENTVSESCQDTSGTPSSSPFRPPAIKSPVAETPVKERPFISPLKSILRTPVKALVESSSGLCLHKGPTSVTPKKSVSWSPSPQKHAVDNPLPFKVPESPRIVPQSSPRFTRTPNSTFRNSNSRTDIFKTPDKKSTEARLENADMFSEEKHQMLSERIHNKKKPLENEEKSDMSHLGTPSQVIPPIDHHLSSKPNTECQVKSLSPTYQMVTRSGRTPSKSSNIVSPCASLFTPDCGTAVSETSDILQQTSTTSVDEIKSGKAAVSRTRCNLRSRTSVNVTSGIKTKSRFGDTSDHAEKHLHSDAEEGSQTESSQTSGTDSSLHRESPQFDSSHVSTPTTEDGSINIVDAAIIKTEFSSDLKMSISFSRKPSQSTDKFLHHGTSPKSLVPRTNYGFRQTPDRQQREAAARLGYSNDSPRFSTPRGSARSAQQKGTVIPNPVTYEVEMEMQSSGLPKLKIKRTASLNPGSVAPYAGSCSAAQSPVANMKLSQLESPVALLSKHRDPGCVSPSICTHVTPAKNTPAKTGSLQTYICQSYTSTQHNAGTVSPVVVAEFVPLTPSPQSVGKVTPDNLNNWPRRKKAQVGVVGAKDRILRGEPQLEELLEEAELGVCRLQDNDDTDEPPSNKSAASTSKQPLCVGADASPLSPLNDLKWMEKLAQQEDCRDLQTAESNMIWATGPEAKSTVTPPSTKVRKPVTASGILALTCSPLLFKGKTGSTIKKSTQFKDETVYERRLEFEPSPVSQPVRRSHTGKANSRKRLLH